MIKISVELSWNFSWKVFTTGQMFTRLTYFQHHWPALNFSNAAVFLLPGLNFFVYFHPAFAKFKPAPLELEKSCPLPPRTLLSRTRPADHPNPWPSRTFSVPIPRLSEKTTKNSSPLNTRLTKQQNQADHSFHWQPKCFHTSDLPQIWGDKNHVSVELWPGVRQALSYPFRRAARLNYSSPSTTVALENGKIALENCEMLTCLVPTTWQERALMFRKNGLLHRNVITALGLLA